MNTTTLLLSGVTSRDLSTPARRAIYTATLEAHIDDLHHQLNTLGHPVASEQSLQEFHGLENKLAKVTPRRYGPADG